MVLWDHFVDDFRDDVFWHVNWRGADIFQVVPVSGVEWSFSFFKKLLQILKIWRDLSHKKVEENRRNFAEHSSKFVARTQRSRTESSLYLESTLSDLS